MSSPYYPLRELRDVTRVLIAPYPGGRLRDVNAYKLDRDTHCGQCARRIRAGLWFVRSHGAPACFHCLTFGPLRSTLGVSPHAQP